MGVFEGTVLGVVLRETKGKNHPSWGFQLRTGRAIFQLRWILSGPHKPLVPMNCFFEACTLNMHRPMFLKSSALRIGLDKSDL